MEIKEIAAISGKGGLFKILKPTRSGVIVESLDGKKKKMVVNSASRISVLGEISIFTDTAEGSVALETIYQKIYAEFGEDPGVTPTSDADELKAFTKHILPEYDRDRVYVSDMKKMINWYLILTEVAPEILKGSGETAEETPAESAEAEAEAKEAPDAAEDSTAKAVEE